MIQLSKFENLVLTEVLHCPGPTVTHAVKQSIINFAEETWIFSKSFNITVLADDIDSTLNDAVDIDVGQYVTDKFVIAVSDFLINGAPWRLKYLAIEDETSYIRSLRDTDEKLFSFPDNSTVRVHELTAGQELFLTVVYKPTYDIVEIDDILYNDWVEPIIAGAKMRLMSIPGQPWTEGGLSVYYRSIANRGMSEAKRKVQKNYTKAPGHVNWRAFGE